MLKKQIHGKGEIVMKTENNKLTRKEIEKCVDSIIPVNNSEDYFTVNAHNLLLGKLIKYSREDNALTINDLLKIVIEQEENI